MTTNKVKCGQGKCPFTDEFCASGDCPYDTENMLKNQQNFNISEGNVKEDDINVANNVAQRNSQDLTELWKKGKLEVGEEYWVILTDERYLRSIVVPVRAFYSCECGFEGYLDNEIKEVLAPVPSFEEYKDLKLHDEKATIKLGEKIIENDKLKSLLKECKQRFETYKRVKPCGEYMIYDLEYLTSKIDEVLK